MTTGPLEELVAACESAFIGGETAGFPDADDVTTPACGISFGVIRRARAALAEPATPSDRELLLSFIGSVSLADHMGDAANSVVTLLERLEIATPLADDSFDWWSGLRRDLHALGVKTLSGSELYYPEDDEEDDEEILQ